ncbi:class I SAM-dependent methyltransferase [Streptacidiphilus sp. EB129]|uniref:class I SAM-dependent methyltransferase n=1 Tax=Streptacidiphilus sp. EB129 TaxID=3156262 RepID=UPI0035155036
MPTTTEQANQERKASIAHGFDLVAETIDTTANGAFFQGLGRRLVEHAGLRPGDRVLDLGCGRGAVLLAAAEAVGPDGYAAGIDLSPASVRSAAARITERRLRNVTVRVDDAEDPGFPARSFEAVLAGLMLFITPDPAAVLAAAHRVLTPGGRFAMTTFGHEDPAWQRPLLAALTFGEQDPAEDGTLAQKWSRNRGGNGRLQSVEDIAALLAEAGFREVRTVEEQSVSAYAGPEDWWTSVWSSGRRAALLECIPPERMDAARRAAFAELDKLTVNGALSRRTGIRFTTATKVGRD